MEVNPVQDFYAGATWQQLGAAIDHLDAVITACPDGLWPDRLWPEEPPYENFSAAWYVTFHAIFWLDLHIYGGVEGFAPPPPFTLDELEPAGLLPDRQYSRAELRSYLADIRARAQKTVEGLTDEQAFRECPFIWGTPTYVELLLYTMRHVQEHAAQLSLFLGQHSIRARGWVARPLAPR
ncbi:MAG: DinB family protein [Dehalococcoidia bacterium]